jgi:hypothetical protein
MTDSRDQLIADYADLGVSCGYIGNIYHGPARDGRSFRVFTKVETMQYAGICQYKGTVRHEFQRTTIHVFDVPHNHKGFWMDAVEFDTPAIRAKLDALRAQVAAGTARIIA